MRVKEMGNVKDKSKGVGCGVQGNADDISAAIKIPPDGGEFTSLGKNRPENGTCASH